ncbi:uncharacterized protein LOC121276509 isoform X2 [Carcharodon carcharias]|uniref:uncharacterized protein LOC121276509 isoform X2 n=1 Tax=Carcharodon carcharias TaxID=13397 RepID=UPI001B7EF955|nr:uncharacterized protein LOC121276509 isoform X2 [Carcharodon carcharias]
MKDSVQTWTKDLNCRDEMLAQRACPFAEEMAGLQPVISYSLIAVDDKSRYCAIRLPEMSSLSVDYCWECWIPLKENWKS